MRRDSLVALDAKKYQEMVIDLDYDNDLMDGDAGEA